ncbi:unnamed protein product [Mycena citricolor]|uniref:Uncharacterized protein n=1 Tax=Mycena citricolor TaxID=2018698 RepID=A0AAD2HYM0_9AGAR|nr:unnamed protein product [Mycena citricolor]
MAEESLIQRAARRAAAQAASLQSSRASTPAANPSSPIRGSTPLSLFERRDNTPDFPPLSQPRFPGSVRTFGERFARDSNLSVEGEALIHSSTPFSLSERQDNTPEFPPLGQPRFAGSVRTFGERLAKDGNLSVEGEAEFRRYYETLNKDERDTFGAFLVVQTKDLLRKLTDNVASSPKDVEYSPADSLVKISRKYVWAILCLPNLAYYTGTIEAAVISTLNIMKNKHVPDLDAPDYNNFLSWLGRQISLYRSIMKTHVSDSLKTRNKDKKNIAFVCAQILDHVDSSVNPNRAFYMRVAYMRYHLKKGHPVKAYWDKVDEEMEQLRNAGPTHLILGLEEVYNDDIATYGNPADTDYTIGESALPKDSPKWLSALSAQAAKVQRFSRKQGKKRSRQQRDEDEDEDEVIVEDDLPRPSPSLRAVSRSGSLAPVGADAELAN